MLAVFSQLGQDLSSIARKGTRQTRGYVDQVAAQIILQNYLDSSAQQKAAGNFFTKNLGSFRNTQRPDRSLLKEGYRYSSRMPLIVSSEPFE